MFLSASLPSFTAVLLGLLSPKSLAFTAGHYSKLRTPSTSAPAAVGIFHFGNSAHSRILSWAHINPSCDDSEEFSAPKLSGNGHAHSRRSMLHTASMSFAGTVSSGPLAALLRSLGDEPEAGGCKSRANRNVANAMGLVRFPCPPGTLMNTYHLIRAGESGYEANDVLITNPLFLTNREDALTDLGIIQVEEACNEMMSKGMNPSVVKYSLAAKCIDTVNIMATNMMIGRNRIVPEFTFMDQRQAGLWDGKPLSTTEPAMFALDATEAGKEGLDGRPPANEDGTANETLYDQVVRLRQLMSILETQYSGDEIVLVFPDGGSPALLSCLIAGIPLNKCHALNFAPGEIRFNVNMENSLKLLDEKISSPEYNDAVTMGNEQLVALRTAPVEEEEKKFVDPSPSATTETVAIKPSKQSELAKALASDGQKEIPGSPDFFSFWALGAAGSLAMWNGGKEKEDEEPILERSSVPTLAFANATGTSTSLFEPSTTFDAVNLQSTTSRKTVATVPRNVAEEKVGFMNPNVFEDVPVLTKEERIEAANKAMEEYLNQDDGGEAWLSAMNEIMNED
mmetsp:Transcript_23051/g.46915  ORF Transcript_23051/g.46915 Transcript_23051/m.46915 type:complete len:567 (+) Transcript_23051:121-1821(+)